MISRVDYGKQNLCALKKRKCEDYRFPFLRANYTKLNPCGALQASPHHEFEYIFTSIMSFVPGCRFYIRSRVFHPQISLHKFRVSDFNLSEFILAPSEFSNFNFRIFRVLILIYPLYIFQIQPCPSNFILRISIFT